MKVLHIISGDLWAGAEVQAFTLLTAMKRSNHVQVAAVLMNEGELAKKLREQDIPVTVITETEMGALSIVLKLRKLFKQWKPDIVHTHRNKENILGSIANKLATNARSVRTVHGSTESPSNQIHKQLLAQLNYWTGKHLQEKVIAVSPELAQRLIPIFSAKKIAVIENGVDIDFVLSQVHPVDFKIKQPNAIHVGIIGRLVPVKRVDIFLEMAALLQNESPQYHWHFHIIGSGPLQQVLEEHAANLGISSSITFHGHRHDIIPCMAALNAIVMCSDHEGLPMTLLEALALNKPVIGHAVGGIQSTLSLVNPALLVHEQTPREFAKAVLRVVSKTQTDLPQSNQQMFEQRFSSATNLNRTLDIYRDALRGQS